MNRILLSLTGGLLMAIGLGLSGLTRPDASVGFLDFFGRWNPTALYVMAGAATTYGVAFQIRSRHARWFHSAPIRPPDYTRIDGALLGGSALFGIGWGLSGLCPGPALVSLSTGARPLVVFVASMLGGMTLYALGAAGGWRRALRRRRRS